MKFGLITLIILLGLMQYNDAGPLRTRFNKRAVFYVANETACVVDNIVFFNGEPIPTDDPCETCRCRPPGFACVLHNCDIKPGCRAIRRDGLCCPEYVCGCEHDGRWYKDGEEIINSQNPCSVCYCHEGSIACSLVDCYYRVDCAPVHVPGECCPRYDNCTSISDDDEFSSTENTEKSSSEQPISVATFLSILAGESTLPKESLSPEVTDISEKRQHITPGSILVGPFILPGFTETKTEEPVEKSQETDTIQNSENNPSDTSYLDKEIAVETPVNNIFLNSDEDLNGEESNEETKEEIMTVADKKETEVIVFSTEESDELEVATSETVVIFSGLPDTSEDSTEKMDEAITVQAMDETINPEAKRKSMKLPEEEEVSTDIVSKENIEPITRDQSEEQTSAPETLVKETSNGTKVLFREDLSTENSEVSSNESEESTQTYEEIDSKTKEPMNENDRVTEQVITNEGKKPRSEENEETVTLSSEENKETVTLVVLVKDNVDEITENIDESKGEQPVEEEGKSIEEAEKSEMETGLSLEEADPSVEERQDKEAVMSVEEVDQPVEEAEKTVKETDISVEEVEHPVEEAEKSVEETEMSVEETEKPVKETEMSVEEVDHPVEEAEKPVKETEMSVEEVDHPVEEAENPVKETEMSVEEGERSVEKVEQPKEEFDQSDERVISSAPANQENRYKALDEAILSAFVPDGSTSVDESLDESRSSATETSETAEKEDTSNQAEAMVTLLTESTLFSEAEVTAMNVGENISTESEQIQDDTKERE